MQTKFLKAIPAGLAFVVIVSSISLSCRKSISDGEELQSTDPTPESIIAEADQAIAPYNLNVLFAWQMWCGFLKV